MIANLPTVVVPVFNGFAALDACVASLERTLPPGAAVLIADDASSDPHVEPLARGWCYRSKLAARYVRREQRLGLAANCNAAISAIDSEDVVLFKPSAVATPGWLQQLAQCAAHDLRIASISPWSNDAELCSFPRFAEPNPAPEFPEVLAEAAASAAWTDSPDLPATSGACIYLRGAALRQLGGLDSGTFVGDNAAEDFCRRAAAMGWRNVLCPRAYVVTGGSESREFADGEDRFRLLCRWPDYQEQVARFILSDSLRPWRECLQTRLEELARSGPQRDLFN